MEGTSNCGVSKIKTGGRGAGVLVGVHKWFGSGLFPVLHCPGDQSLGSCTG